MTTHTIGYDPDIFILVHQNRIFIFCSDAAGIGDAVAMNMEVDRGLPIVISCIA
jgi:hypothetical protein